MIHAFLAQLAGTNQTLLHHHASNAQQVLPQTQVLLLAPFAHQVLSVLVTMLLVVLALLAQLVTFQAMVQTTAPSVHLVSPVTAQR